MNDDDHHHNENINNNNNNIISLLTLLLQACRHFSLSPNGRAMWISNSPEPDSPYNSCQRSWDSMVANATFRTLFNAQIKQ
jgi:hypothetical protein